MFTKNGNYPQRRTFLAAKVNNERLRSQLNDDPRTSEYLTSRKWCVINNNISELFATKKEAAQFCKEHEDDQAAEA